MNTHTYIYIYTYIIHTLIQLTGNMLAVLVKQAEGEGDLGSLEPQRCLPPRRVGDFEQHHRLLCVPGHLKWV